MTTLKYTFIGVDIAKADFHAHAHHLSNKNKTKRFLNQTNGFESFRQWLTAFDNPWVIMEATGPYHEDLALTLLTFGIRTSVCNPASVKAFMVSKLRRVKTDARDAIYLAHYGELYQPRCFTPVSPTQRQLQDYGKLIDQLDGAIKRLNQLLESTRDNIVRDHIHQTVEQLNQQKAQRHRDMATLIEQDPHLKADKALLLSIPGIGQYTAHYLLMAIRHIGDFDHPKQFAAFLGLNVRHHDSGTSIHGRPRLAKIGHHRLRKALLMPAMVAKRHRAYQPFVNRLTLNGKHNMVIIGALMRKLAHIIFGVLTHRQPFDPACACR